MNNGNIIYLDSVSKNFQRGSETIHALQGVNLSVMPGEFIGVIGYSGSGKTTLLNIIGCLDRPSEGRVKILGQEIQNAPEKELTKIRKAAIGFVFQQFFLIPTLTVMQNVMLPALFVNRRANESARELLNFIGLGKRLEHLPNQLSGGEMQRVAIARSLINKPQILLADEPTGNLDTHNAETIISMFEELNRTGLTIIMVTHNPDLVKRCSRLIHIEDGVIEQ